MQPKCITQLGRIEPSFFRPVNRRMWRQTGCIWEHHGKEENWIVCSSNAVNKRSEKTMSPVYLQQDSTVLRDVHQATVHSVCYLIVSRLLNFLTRLILIVSSGMPHLKSCAICKVTFGTLLGYYELWLRGSDMFEFWNKACFKIILICCQCACVENLAMT